MKIRDLFIKERIIQFGIFIVTMLLCLIPLFCVNCIQGHDLPYHLLRIESLKEAILMGKPFMKINPLFFGGRGYASSMFYPDFVLFIPATLRVFGVSINLSYHLFVAFCFIASYFSMHLVAKELTNNMYIATLAASMYSLAQYHLDDVYTRAAVGEFTAMIFFPLLLYGLYEVYSGIIDKPLYIILGFSGIVLCHTISTVFAIALYFLVFLISIKKYIKSPKAVVTIAASALMAVLLTSFYWMPMIEQLLSGKFCGAAEFDLNYEKLFLMDIFTNTCPGMGIVIFIPLLLRLFLAKNTRIKFADILTFSGIIAVIASTGFLPWARLQSVLGFIQFPWRTFVVATPVLSLAGAIYVGEYLGYSFKDRVSQLVFVGTIIIFGVAAIGTFGRLDQGYYSYSDDYYSYIPYTGEVIGGEWLPETVTDRGALTNNCNMAVTENGMIEVVRYKDTLSFIADDSEYVDVPFIYYKGYKAICDGVELPVYSDGENGMCRLKASGYSGRKITVYYEWTNIQVISLILSVFALLVLIFFNVKKKIWRKNR